MRDTGIADRLRDAGLKVIEVDGWQTRGSDDFDPRGSVDHHTASSPLGNAPSLAICISGRSDLPGPLCHVLMARDNTCYVVAAGRANHAGEGGWQGLTSNSQVYGVERENVGTTDEPWRADQTLAAAKCHAALIRGRTTVDKVCLHREWAPTRKIDSHTITGDQLRAMTASVLAGTLEEDDMTPDQAKLLAAVDQRTEALFDALVLDDSRKLRKLVRQEVAGRLNATRLAERIAKNTPGADAKVIAEAVRGELADALGGDED